MDDGFVFSLLQCAHPLLLLFALQLMLLLLLSHRRTLLLATGILVAGGTAAYVQSRFSCRKPDSFSHHNGVDDTNKNSEVVQDNNVKKTTRKKGALKSLQVLAGVLLSEMGKMGTRDLLALAAIVVSLLCVDLRCGI